LQELIFPTTRIRLVTTFKSYHRWKTHQCSFNERISTGFAKFHPKINIFFLPGMLVTKK